MVSRRSFFGGLLGLFGLGGVAKAMEVKSAKLLSRMGDISPGSWTENWVYVVQEALKKELQGDRVGGDGLVGFVSPNADETWNQFYQQAGWDLEHFGQTLIWMVSDALGRVKELFVLPLAGTTAHPAIQPDYPDGYYRVLPHFPELPMPYGSVGAPIASKWVLSVKDPEPWRRLRGVDQKRWDAMQRQIDPSGIQWFSSKK